MSAPDSTPAPDRRIDGDDEARPDGTAPLELLTDDGDEWTMVPADADGHRRMSRWLTVDRDALCDLREWR